MRGSSRLLTAMLVCITSLSIPLISAPSALADTIECSQKIVDATRDKVLDTTAILAAVDGVEAQGADVYVRAFETTPGGNADAFWEQGLDQCSNWRTPGGTPKANVIVVMFGMDRTSGIFFNASSFSSLQDRFGSIMSEDMGPNFRSEEFTAGITSSLNSIAREIDPNKPAPQQADYSGVWTALLGILGGILCFAAMAASVVFGGKYIRRRREEKSERLSAQAKAQKAKARVEQLVTTTKDVGVMERELLVAVGDLPEPMAGVRRSELRSIVSLYETTNSSYVASVTDPSSDPYKRLTTARYEEIGADFTQIGDDMKAVGTLFGALIEATGEDKRKLSKTVRTERADAMAREIGQFALTLAECESAFEIAPYKRELETLKIELNDARNALEADTPTWAWVSHAGLDKLDEHIDAFAQTCRELTIAYEKIAGARELISEETQSRRSVLEQLKHVEKDAAFQELESVSETADSLYRALSASRAHDEQIVDIDLLIGRIKAAGSTAVAEDQEIVKAKKKEAEDEERARKTRRRSSGSFSDSVTGGVVGGYIGSSSSSSSSSSRNTDYGGGGSSWGGGGGDFGGGGGSW